MYIPVDQAAEKWGVSPRQVQRLLAAGRIPLAKKFGRSWMIPEDAEQPDDQRREKKNQPENPLPDDLVKVIAATLEPYPFANPDAVLDTVGEDRLRLQYEAELAYLRGNFARVVECFRLMGDDDAARLRACPGAIAAAICTGNYPLYAEIESYLQGIIRTQSDPLVIGVAELALNTAYVSAYAPNMVSAWLKAGDFSIFPQKGRSNLAYKRAKYFQAIGEQQSALDIAQTALSIYDTGDGILYDGIYLRVVCATALCRLERRDEAEAYLLDALGVALPHGFITPFAELANGFDGLLEKLLKRRYPEYLAAVTEGWGLTMANWISFHNEFTKNNITSILSLRECEIASLVARRTPRAAIALQFNISPGRLNNIITEIYGKLFVSSREELANYIL